MCAVHLIESSRTTREVPEGSVCCYCASRLAGVAVEIKGHLDDGSPGLHRFVYHEECVWHMEHDLEQIAAHEGCFSYGVPVEVVDASLNR